MVSDDEANTRCDRDRSVDRADGEGDASPEYSDEFTNESMGEFSNRGYGEGNQTNIQYV